MRVLRADGLFILGTPDYATIGWRLIEPFYGFFDPGAYRPGHGTHYTLENLTELARRHDLEITSRAYVFKSELILGLAQARPGRRGQRVGAERGVGRRTLRRARRGRARHMSPAFTCVVIHGITSSRTVSRGVVASKPSRCFAFSTDGTRFCTSYLKGASGT